MKSLFLATCIAAGVTIAPVAMAGPGEGAYSSAMMSRATTLTRALAQHIPFNEAQYLAIKQLHLQIVLNGASAEERDNQLAIAQQRYETGLSQLLQPQQLVAYQNLRTSFTAHRLK
jgi:hypothetical protein